MTYREAPAGGVRVTLAARTETGPVRCHNEDAWLALDLATGAAVGAEGRREVVEAGAGLLLVVLDGMGGASAGEDACRVAIEAMQRRLGAGAERGREGLRRAVAGAVADAGQAVWTAAAQDRRLTGMGAAMTAAAIDGGQAHLAHVGDTRAYLLRGGRLEQITRDDSLLNDAVAHGFTEAQLEELPRNVITKALGLKEEIEPSTWTVELAEGDVLLLCSDGVHGVIAGAAIEALLRLHPEPEAACTALIDAAIGAGSSDNLTALVVRVEGEGAPAIAGVGGSSGALPSKAPEHGGGAPPVLIEVDTWLHRREPRCDQVLVLDLAARDRWGPLLPALLSGDAGVALAALRGLPAHLDAASAVVKAAADALRGVLLSAPLPPESAARRTRLRDAARAAAAAVRAARQGPPRRDAGVALTAALIAGAELHLAHVGTGRAYVMRRGRLAAVTRDDTLINEARALDHLRAQGLAEPEITELMELQGRAVITRLLGVTPDVDPVMETLTLREGDVIVLGTEGLAQAIPEEVLADLLRAHRSPREICRALLEPARWHGRREDLAAIVAAARGPGLAPPGEGDAIEDRNQPAWRP